MLNMELNMILIALMEILDTREIYSRFYPKHWNKLRHWLFAKIPLLVLVNDMSFLLLSLPLEMTLPY